MYILGIESSCDETSVSVLEIKNGVFNVLSNIISSQVKIHAKYGGVVPEVAARLHIQNILPLLDLSLKEAKIKIEEIDYIAVCAGPGLMSSLMVGVETAKSLAYAYNKPLIRVNHLEGHLLSALLKSAALRDVAVAPPQSDRLLFPAIGLIVSGGHTQLVFIKNFLQYKLIGGTRDDAAGEAFDKVAKIMGLGYPGGPAISQWADKCKINKFKIKLPRPMIDSDNFDLSFSGLKTHVLYTWQDWQKKIDKQDLNIFKRELAKEFQNAVVDVLCLKTLKAVERLKVRTVLLGGGVSANKTLTKELSARLKNSFPKVKFITPDIKLTGDNAGMIALAGYYHALKKDFTEPFELTADPNWELV